MKNPQHDRGDLEQTVLAEFTQFRRRIERWANVIDRAVLQLIDDYTVALILKLVIRREVPNSARHGREPRTVVEYDDFLLETGRAEDYDRLRLFRDFINEILDERQWDDAIESEPIVVGEEFEGEFKEVAEFSRSAFFRSGSNLYKGSEFRG